MRSGQLCCRFTAVFPGGSLRHRLPNPDRHGGPVHSLVSSPPQVFYERLYRNVSTFTNKSVKFVLGLKVLLAVIVEQAV